MLESFDFRNHFCLVFDLLGMSMYDFLRCVAALLSQPPRVSCNFISNSCSGCIAMNVSSCATMPLTTAGWLPLAQCGIACNPRE